MYNAGDELPGASGDVTLIAVFDSTFYLVSFQMPDKTLISQSYGYYGAAIKVPEAPEAPDGYVFAGWDGEFGDKITKSATYTAVFEPITVTTEQESVTTESETQAPTDTSAGCKASAALPAIAILPLAMIPFAFKKKNK